MAKRRLESLGIMVRENRGYKKLRETAREIGIGSATLMRVESGRTPDLATFGKLCIWLKIDPAEFLGTDSAAKKKPAEQTHAVVTSHFKAEQTPKPETVKALAQMVLIALSTQPGLSDPEN